GSARVVLADVSVRPDDDRRAAILRFRIDDGDVVARGAHVTGLAGAASAALASDAMSFDVAAEAEAVDAAGIALGAVTVTASGRDGSARFAIRAPEAELANVSIDGEATFTATERAVALTGSVELGPRAHA